MPQNAIAARSKRQPQSNLPPTVGGACREQAAEVGTRSQQNQPGQQHQSRNESPHRTAKNVAEKTWTRQDKGHFAIVFGITLLQIRANEVQIGNRLCRDRKSVV